MANEIANNPMKEDLLRCDFINSRPWMVTLLGVDNAKYDLLQICVQTGFLTFNVSGRPQNGHIGDVSKFIDWDGNEFEIDVFYSDYTKKDQK